MQFLQEQRREGRGLRQPQPKGSEGELYVPYSTTLPMPHLQSHRGQGPHPQVLPQEEDLQRGGYDSHEPEEKLKDPVHLELLLNLLPNNKIIYCLHLSLVVFLYSYSNYLYLRRLDDRAWN